MKDIYKDQLFNHGILVCEQRVTPDVAFATRFLLAGTYGVRITSGKSLVTEDMVPYVAGRLGEAVPEPFYKGFPESVRKLAPDQLLFDQALHYFRTYGLGDFSGQGHSLLEEDVERLAFHEKCDPKDFTVLTEKEAVIRLSEYVEALTAGTRPLSDDQYSFVCSYIRDYEYTVRNCASKNLAIRLLHDFREVQYADFLSMSDVMKLVDEINYRDYKNDDVRKLNLKNQDRKFLTKVINHLFRSDSCDIRNCCQQKALWCGLLHHIHYKPFDEMSARFVENMRGKGNFSVLAEFEHALAEKDIRAAVKALQSGKGTGAILRNLNYIVSRCETAQDIDFVCSQISSSNGIVLLQLLMNYSTRNGQTGGRQFRFTRHNMLCVHRETPEEQNRRRSFLSDEAAEKLCSVIRENLQKVYGGRLGKVFIDAAMENIALPLQENTSSGGYGVLPRGSRLHIEADKKVRAFTYWEKVDDIDLSLIGIREDGSQMEFSWRTMFGLQSSAITFSGDETSGYNGGSEYFDIDVLKLRKLYPDLEYLVFCDNVYSQGVFRDCVCRAGYMLRDHRDSGEIYEPKTVKTSFTIDCDSSFAYLFAIDLEKNDFIWLNVARESLARIAGTTDLDFLTAYFDVTSVMNLKQFFTMLASEVVDDINEAEVIVTDANIAPAPGQKVIKSCDFEQIIRLMN